VPVPSSRIWVTASTVPAAATAATTPNSTHRDRRRSTAHPRPGADGGPPSTHRPAALVSIG
jgi:hypothetical protein